MSALESDVAAYQKEKLRELSERPNTTVLDVEYDHHHDPWPVSRLRPILERLTGRVLSTDDDVADFVLRKQCLEDPDVLAFQRDHPKFYWLLTDRRIMREQKHRDAITGMLYIRDEVERGNVPHGQEADAMATRTVIEALQR
jgi:hypothetical protein